MLQQGESIFHSISIMLSFKIITLEILNFPYNEKKTWGYGGEAPVEGVGGNEDRLEGQAVQIVAEGETSPHKI